MLSTKPPHTVDEVHKELIGLEWILEESI